MNQFVSRFIQNAKQWRNEIEGLREILLGAKLEEKFKWGKPCYAFEGRSIVIIQPFQRCLGLMFFKGALLKDPKNILIDNGPNSKASRRFEFKSTEEIAKAKAIIKS